MKEISLDEAVSMYLAYIRIELSAINYREYFRTLYRFNEFVGFSLMSNIINKTTIFDDFYGHLCIKYKLNDSTLYNSYNHLKNFLIYCKASRLIEKINIEKVINFDKYKNNYRKHFQKQIPETIYLFDEINTRKYWINSEPSLISLRNASFINLMFDTGLKLGELISLRKIDINFNDNQIYLRTKNNRTLQVANSTMVLIKSYLDNRDDKSLYLFINHSKNKFNENITQRSLERIIRMTSKEIQSLAEITCQMVRNSYIAKNIAEGKTRNHVKVISGIRHYHSPNLNKFSLKQVNEDNSKKNTQRYLGDFDKVKNISKIFKLTEREEIEINRSVIIDSKYVSRTNLLSEYHVTKYLERDLDYLGYILVSKRQKEWNLDKDLFLRLSHFQPENFLSKNGMLYIKENIELNDFISSIKVTHDTKLDMSILGILKRRDSQRSKYQSNH